MKPNLTPHFIGIGHGGRFMTRTFQVSGIEGRFSAVFYPHSNAPVARYAAEPEGIQVIPFYPPAQKITHKDGIEIYRSADWHQAPKITPEIRDLFRKGHHYILLADFGDYTGVRLTEALIEWLHQRQFSFRVLVLQNSVYNAGPFRDKALETKERLSRFEEFECLNPRELPGIGPQTTLVELIDFQNAALLRLYREGAQ